MLFFTDFWRIFPSYRYVNRLPYMAHIVVHPRPRRAPAFGTQKALMAHVVPRRTDSLCGDFSHWVNEPR